MAGVCSWFSPWVLFHLPNTLLNGDSMVGRIGMGQKKIFRQYDGGSDVFETGKTAISSPSPSPMTCLYQPPGVEQWRHQFQQFNWHQWQYPVIFGDHQLFTNGFTDHTSTNSSAHNMEKHLIRLMPCRNQKV